MGESLGTEEDKQNWGPELHRTLNQWAMNSLSYATSATPPQTDDVFMGCLRCMLEMNLDWKVEERLGYERPGYCTFFVSDEAAMRPPHNRVFPTNETNISAPIRRVAVLGDFRSGVGFAEDTLARNFGLVPTRDYDDPHMFGFRCFPGNLDDVLFVGVVRDPVQWILSFLHHRHLLPLSRETSRTWFETLFGPVHLEPMTHNHDDKVLFELREGRDIFTKKVYRDAMTMRAVKSRYLLKVMPSRVRHFVLLRYEDLRDDLDGSLSALEAQVPVLNRTISGTLAFETSNSSQNSQGWKGEGTYAIDDCLAKRLKPLFDTEVEEMLGYNIESSFAVALEEQRRQRAGQGPNITSAIKRVTIFGERCSGTSFIEAAIKKNFEIEWAGWDYGWKHGFSHDCFPFVDDLLVLVVVRNPVDWLGSFFRTPHHLDPEMITTFADFLTQPVKTWEMVEDRVDEQIGEDRNPNTLRPFRDVFELRARKLQYLLDELSLKVSHYYLVSYEDFKANYTASLHKIQQRFSLTLRKNNVQSSKKSSETFVPVEGYKGFKDFGPNSKGRSYKVDDLPTAAYIYDKLDRRLEGRLGYGDEAVAVALGWNRSTLEGAWKTGISMNLFHS